MPTLHQYITRAAREFEQKSFVPFTSSATSGSTTTVVASSLIDSNVPSTHYGKGYLMAASGALLDSQRRVTEGGYDNATGTLTVSNAFGGTPASGVSWLFTKRFPMIQQGTQAGWREFINAALQKIWVIDELPFTASGSTQVEYALTSYPWLTTDERIINVLDPNDTVTGATSRNGRRAWIRKNSETQMLVLSSAFADAEAWFLQVYSPGWSRLKLSGSWAAQTNPNAGLVLLADEAPPGADIETVTLFALAEAYHALYNPSGGQYVAEYKQAWEEAKRAAEKTKRINLPSENRIRLRTGLIGGTGIGGRA